MQSLVSMEVKKAFRGKAFFIALAIGCVLALGTTALNCFITFPASVDAAGSYQTKWFDQSLLSCFRYWVVTDYNHPTTYLFFMLLPLLAMLPYSWSLARERVTGYCIHVLSRAERKDYLVAKGAACFLSGAAATTIPVAVSLVIVACVAPARVPDVTAMIYFGVFEPCLWSEAFYQVPVLYCFLYLLLIFSFSGLWALAVSSIGAFIGSRIVILVGPYLFLLGVKFFCEDVLLGIVRTELTPFGFLRPSGNLYTPNGWVILGVLAACLALAVIVLRIARRRDVL